MSAVGRLFGTCALSRRLDRLSPADQIPRNAGTASPLDGGKGDMHAAGAVPTGLSGDVRLSFWLH